MADDELELDYEEEKDEIKEELQEKKADPSEGSNDADKTEGRETSRQSRRDIFTSGRLSGLKSEWADDSSEKQRDGYDEEESSDDSDTEKGDFFQGTASRTQETFPSFPITREGVKEDLGLTNRQLRSAIKVFGTKGIKPFEILKVFSEFGANRLNEIDQDSCLVQFQSKKLALRMMVQMSRTLTTNLRHFIQHKEDERKVADDEMDTTETKEEGEVESDDDEGEVQDHQSRNSCYKIGDDVRNTDHVTYINWRKYSVPEQKWRVVEKHVPGGRVLLVNFATSKEKSMAEKNPNQIAFPGKNVDSTGLEYLWQGEKVRPGLNIYTNDGEELDWDFQHDTRGYKKADSKDHEEEVEREWEKPALQVGIKGAVKVRGRGAKRFLGEDSETLNSDETSEQTKKPRKRNDSDDWRSAKPSQKPTRRFD